MLIQEGHRCLSSPANICAKAADMGGTITISSREEKGQCIAAWRALDENEYEHLNIAVSETRFLDTLLQR